MTLHETVCAEMDERDLVKVVAAIVLEYGGVLIAEIAAFGALAWLIGNPTTSGLWLFEALLLLALFLAGLWLMRTGRKADQNVRAAQSRLLPPKQRAGSRTVALSPVSPGSYPDPTGRG